MAKIGSFRWLNRENSMWWSEGLYYLLGCEQDSSQATKQKFLDLIHAEDRDNFLQDISASLRSQKPLSGEYRCKHQSARWLYCKVEAVAIANEKAEITELQGTVQEISCQKKSEKELRRNAERFRRWKESNFIGIIQSNTQGAIIDANKTFLSMLGYSEHDIKNGSLDWKTLTPPEFLHLDDMAVKESKVKGFWTPFEKEYIHKSGHRVPVKLGGSIFDRENEEYIVFVIDLTEKKTLEGELEIRSEFIDSAQEKIRKTERKLQETSYLMNRTMIIAYTDADGLITTVNEKFLEISGYSEKELIGRTHNIVNSGFHKERFFASMWMTISAGRDWHGQIMNRAKNGSFYWVDTYIHPVKSDDGEITGYVSIRKDITKEKERLKSDLRSTRMIAIGETTTQIIHDVMNPLAVIKLAGSRFSHMNFPQDIENEAKTCSLAIQSGVEKIKQIFADMRSMLDGKVNIAPVNLSVIIDDTRDLMDSLLNKNNISFSKISEDKVLILGNRSLLIQLFSNMVKNAIEAVANLEKKWIRIEIATNDKVEVRIADSGHGIPLVVQQHIFDSFYTTKEATGGTGVGMDICRKIIDIHKGSISINNKSKNTEFLMLFDRISYIPKEQT